MATKNQTKAQIEMATTPLSNDDLDGPWVIGSNDFFSKDKVQEALKAAADANRHYAIVRGKANPYKGNLAKMWRLEVFPVVLDDLARVPPTNANEKIRWMFSVSGPAGPFVLTESGRAKFGHRPGADPYRAKGLPADHVRRLQQQALRELAPMAVLTKMDWVP